MKACTKWICSLLFGVASATASLADNNALIGPLGSCYSDVMISYMAKQYGVTEDAARTAIEKTPDALDSMKVAAAQTVGAHEGGGDVKSQLRELETQLPGISDGLINCYQNVFLLAEPSEVIAGEGTTTHSDSEEEKDLVEIDEGAEIAISCVGFSNETYYKEFTSEQMLFLLGMTGESPITQHSERVSRDYIFEISDGIIKKSEDDPAFAGKPAIVTESYIDLYKTEVSEGEAVFRISRINGKLGAPGNGDSVLTVRKLDFSSESAIEYRNYEYNVNCSPLEQKF